MQIRYYVLNDLIIGVKEMDYRSHQKPIENNQYIRETILMEPYFVQTLRMLIARSVLIETVRGNIQGRLTDVKPDHVVLTSYDNDTSFYIRLQQIVQIMPV